MNLFLKLRAMHLFHKKDRFSPLTTCWGESLDPEHVLEEYPRPQMVRDNYMNLNGLWKYRILSSNDKKELQSGQILVPFSPEAPLSGVDFQILPEHLLLYECNFTTAAPSKDSRCILHFGAVDQTAHIYVNGHSAFMHHGGYLPFSVDITEYINDSLTSLAVVVQDVTDTSHHSTGKQKLKRGGMFYTAQSGIWQTVWLEWVPQIYITDVNVTPHYDHETVHISLHLNQPLTSCHLGKMISCEIFDENGNYLTKGTFTNHSNNLCNYSCYCDINDMVSWTPDHPYLYQYKIFACDDEVSGYFAMRQYSIENDENGIPRFCLNHHPYDLKGVLDQGYWPDGLYTAPSDEAFIFDIRSMKELGFNMIRKHAKIEAARWYYHCDRLGMIVWQDMVNGGGFSAPVMAWLPTLSEHVQTHMSDKLHFILKRRNRQGREEFIRECRETVQALRNFPCISTWVLFNEGWGQFDSARLTESIRKQDPDRLIDSASGWFDQGVGDFKSIHNYFSKQYILKDERACVISELGGYSCRIKDHVNTRSNYGYKTFSNTTKLKQAYEKLFSDEVNPLKEAGLCGTVYTQLSDIEDETNGIFTYDRKICKLNE